MDATKKWVTLLLFQSGKQKGYFATYFLFCNQLNISDAILIAPDILSWRKGINFLRKE